MLSYMDPKNHKNLTEKSLSGSWESYFTSDMALKGEGCLQIN